MAGDLDPSNPKKNPSWLVGLRKKLQAHLDVSALTALRITLIYLVVGSLWILLSDRLVQMFFNNPQSIMLVSIAKGWFYVLTTAVLIFQLIYPAFKQASRATQEAEQKRILQKSMIDSIPDLIFYKDRAGNYLGCNQAFEKFVGVSEAEIIGRQSSAFFSPDTALRFAEADQEILESEATLRNDTVVTTTDGRLVYLDTVKTPYYDTSRQVIGLIGICRDVTAEKQKGRQIQYLSYHDVLTGLYNRAYFLEALERLNTPGQHPISVIVGDINGLKLINDALGHVAGDHILTQIARILKQCSRDGDLVARTGGDEFTILLPKTGQEVTSQIVAQIKDACALYATEYDRETYYADISLGYATKETVHDTFAKAMKLAEDYMYKRKLLESKSLHNSIIASIKTTMFEKSNETEAHAERIAVLARRLGEALGLSDDELVALELLSTLHDIGKIGVDLNILTKIGELSAEDWQEIKRHPEIGYRITQAAPELRHISDFILSHHERWDGLGYPQGLAGFDIPLLSRILSIVDAYDAMTEDRAYRKALPQEEAREKIRQGRGSQFDPAIVDIFLEHVV